eukprot:TRINITY_DN76636_c0_g1_i1.p1 TRINITY_DN76636_c0_g1~~TRINITY_DN76636_c0_g1_i1.p1  ORF type:complete len:298 (-),score=34.64 TRINITY_DN76636_c0_g1_i1:59-865(-)
MLANKRICSHLIENAGSAVVYSTVDFVKDTLKEEIGDVLNAMTEFRIHPSDHYGLCMTVDFHMLEGHPPTSPAPATALVILPPAESWSKINQCRKTLNDANYPNWPPHIPILHPFVPEGELEEASVNIAECIADVGPFKMELSEFDCSTEKSANKKPTIWLTPHSNRFVLQQLYTRLSYQFEESIPQPKREISPKLMLGECILTKDVNQQVQQFNKQWTKAINWDVTHVHVLAKQQDGKMAVVHSIPLVGEMAEFPTAVGVPDDAKCA